MDRKLLVPSFRHFDLTNRAFNSLFDSTAWRDVSGWKEEGDSYTLSVDLPGMDKKNIGIELSCAYLTISAERKVEDEYGKSCESYTNIFSLPEDIDEETLDAKYENDRLIVSGKKVLDTVNTKKIEVK